MTSRALASVLAVGTCALAGCSAAPASGPNAERTNTSSSPPPAAQSPPASEDLIADVELGGRRIHVTCFGPADPAVPTVLLEAGGSTPSDTWDVVMDELSLTRRTCSYDRAGLGASPEAPEPRRTTTDLVADLEATLDGAGIEGPFVLVGHSMAVWLIAVYAAAHPDDVAGVVLVDPRGPHVSSRHRAALPPVRDDEPEAVTVWREEDLGVFEHDPSLNPEHLDLTRSAAEASRLLDPPAPLFGDVPLVVLSASESQVPFADLPPRIVERFDRIWHEEQRSLSEESTAGSYEVVAGSRHNIQVEQPEAVIAAIEAVLSAATPG